MAIIANLDVLLSANTRRFDSNMNRSRSVLSAFSKATIGVGSVMAGAAFATDQLGDEFEKLDEIAKLSARLGDTTEAISRLGFAADLTGAGSKKLNAGLDVLSKRLGEAKAGSGEAKKALDNLGLSADELSKIKPSEAFIVIAERIKNLETQADKAAATSALFSRANQDLVNTLDLGAKGLADMAKQSDTFGATVRGDTVGGIEAANDAITKFQAVANAFKRDLATAVAPTLAKLLTESAELVGNIRELTGQFEKLGMKIPVTPLQEMAKALEAINNLIDQFQGEREGDLRTTAQDIATAGKFLAPRELQPLIQTLDALSKTGRSFETAPLPPRPSSVPAPAATGEVEVDNDTKKTLKNQLTEQKQTNRTLSRIIALSLARI